MKTKALYFVDVFLLHSKFVASMLQGGALRKIEGCSAYDLYEKSEIF